MKLPLFRKDPETAKTDTSTSSHGQMGTVPQSPDPLSHAKEGYFVDCSLSYGEPVDFINEQKGIRKPLIRNHAFVDFPGVDESGFGMENVPEIMLVTFLDEDGDNIGAFRLESVKW